MSALELDERSDGAFPDAIDLPNLPTQFWDQRTVLKHIRMAALARLKSPDTVLAGLLARLAAFSHHGIKVYSGIGSRAGASLNFYAGTVGPSGAGKSEGLRVAKELMPVPEFVDVVDAQPLGTGEGLVECYMGVITDPDENGKAAKVRAQTGHNALFHVDEGVTFTTLCRRQDAILGPTLRSAWGGETIGVRNADSTKTRWADDGTYSLGLTVGYQPSTVAPLLADSGTGLPQRFFWASADYQAASEETVGGFASRTPWPGTLPWSPETIRRGYVMELPLAAQEELYVERLDILSRKLVLAELDGQRPLMLVKLTGLLALLDDRSHITEEDWALAKKLWHCSCRVRDALIEQARRRRDRDEDARTERYVDREVAKTAAVAGMPDAVERVARRIVALIRGSDDGVATNRYLKDRLAGRDKHLRVAAVSFGTSQGWFIASGAALHLGEHAP